MTPNETQLEAHSSHQEIHAIREYFQTHKPSEDDLAESEPEQPCFALGGVLLIRRALIELRETRLRQNRTIEDVASELDIPESTLQSLESLEQFDPSLHLLFAWADCLSLDLSLQFVPKR